MRFTNYDRKSATENKRTREGKKGERATSAFFSHLHWKHLAYLFREWNFEIFLANCDLWFSFYHTHTDKDSAELGGVYGFCVSMRWLPDKSGFMSCHLLVAANIFCYWSMPIGFLPIFFSLQLFSLSKIRSSMNTKISHLFGIIKSGCGIQRGKKRK